MARPGLRTDFSRHRSLSAVRNVVARRLTARSNIQLTKSRKAFVRFWPKPATRITAPPTCRLMGTDGPLSDQRPNHYRSSLRNAWNQNDSGRTSAYGGGSDSPLLEPVCSL